MTTETMREAVEMAILEAAGGMEHGKPANISVLADAAIRTVLERLRGGITDDFLLAARDGEGDVIFGGGVEHYFRTDDEACGYGRQVWQAMLDAAAREVG